MGLHVWSGDVNAETKYGILTKGVRGSFMWRLHGKVSQYYETLFSPKLRKTHMKLL